MNNDAWLMRIGVVSATLFASFTIWRKFGFLDLLGIISPSIMLGVICDWCVKNFLWKVPIIKLFFGNLPNLNGNWRATTLRHGDSEPHYINVKIIQKWYKINLSFDGDRVDAWSTFTHVKREENCLKINYMWTGRFKQSYHHQGDLDGAASLNYNEDTDTLIGKYWTYSGDNSTIGTMNFSKNSNLT